MKRNRLFCQTIFKGGTAVMLAVSACLLLVSCTHTAKIKVTPTAKIQNAAGTTIPLRVALMLDNRFCTFSHKFENMGDTWVYPFGPTLRQQSISLCEQTFQKVTVSTNGVVPAGVDVVLTPEVHRSGYALGIGNKFMFTMLVQWDMRDRDNRNTLWMATVAGQTVDKRSRVFQTLFDDLNAKSYRAFHDSMEIRRIAALGKQP